MLFLFLKEKMFRNLFSIGEKYGIVPKIDALDITQIYEYCRHSNFLNSLSASI